MRIHQEIEYKGYTLIKYGKQHIQILQDGKLIGYSTTEKKVKEIVDRRENKI